MTDDAGLRSMLAELLGPPVWFQVLKHKPGRRRTVRAVGRGGSVIVKLYASQRAPTVAARIEALSTGPAEPAVPRVLLCDADQRMVVLSHVPGAPLSRAVLTSDRETCSRAGFALGAWHAFWTGRAPRCLRPQTTEREIAVIDARARGLPAPTAERVRRLARRLQPTWTCSTVVHRDLYEEQVVVGDQIGLIDLDDAALGPPELDVGNLLAHLDLLALRAGRRLDGMAGELLAGYADSEGILDPLILDRCRRLSLLRLVCIHREPRLLKLAESLAGRKHSARASARGFGIPR
jgi:Ser/Thr protein kinase RdoA (MazF antagonist)